MKRKNFFPENVIQRNSYRESVIQISPVIRETQKKFYGEIPFELIVYQLKKTQILKRVKGKYEREQRNAHIEIHRHTSHPRRFLVWLLDLFNRSTGAVKSIMKRTIIDTLCLYRSP